MNKYSSALWASACAALMFGACSKDSNKSNDTGTTPVDPTETGRYVLAVSPVSSTGVADYLLTAANLDSGKVSTERNGVEQDGTYRYYVTHNNKFFSMLYGQGNPGAVTAYDLSTQGELNKLTNFQTETVQAFAPAGDDILMFKVPRSSTGGDNALWYRVNTSSLTIVAEGQSNIVAMTGTEERAHFTWLKQVNDKIFAPYMSIKGCCGDGFGTAYPDSAWIAVYSYPDMTLEKIIRDNRTSYIGRYFTDGLEVVENNDVYAFSSAVATNGGKNTSTKPSAITRLLSGTTEFDQNYYFDIEQASGGAYLTNKLYLGNNIFLLSMATEKGAYSTGNRFAIVNVNTKSFTWVTGTPDAAQVADVTVNNYSPKDGKTGYVGITLTDGTSAVYKFDASSASAVKGLVVEGGTITAVNRLDWK